MPSSSIYCQIITERHKTTTETQREAWNNLKWTRHDHEEEQNMTKRHKKHHKGIQNKYKNTQNNHREWHYYHKHTTETQNYKKCDINVPQINIKHHIETHKTATKRAQNENYLIFFNRRQTSLHQNNLKKCSFDFGTNCSFWIQKNPKCEHELINWCASIQELCQMWFKQVVWRVSVCSGRLRQQQP